MTTQDIIDLTQKYVMDTYARFPLAFVKGEGCYLWDAEGKKYLDLLAGIAVNGLGHSHPKITATLERQARILTHTSNLFYIQSQAELAEMLCRRSFAGKAFFCNSGAEANEAAIKLARKYQKEKKGPECIEIITMEKSFHGRTFAMMAATAQERIKRGFEPLPEGFFHVPYDDIPSLKKAIGPKTCAVLLEPIQGEGGVRFPAENYLKEVREICHQHKILLIYDEIQTGMGRTGKLFAYEHSGIAPDILTLAKSLGAGLPIGGCLATDEVASAFHPGDHASTFGGNFLVCEAAKTFIQCLMEEGVLENAVRSGKYFLKLLQELKKKYSFIREVKGAGLMLGAYLGIPGKPLVEACLQRGLIINCTQETTLRFVPPLILTTEQIDEAMKILDDVFSQVKVSHEK